MAKNLILHWPSWVKRGVSEMTDFGKYSLFHLFETFWIVLMVKMRVRNSFEDFTLYRHRSD